WDVLTCFERIDLKFRIPARLHVGASVTACPYTRGRLALEVNRLQVHASMTCVRHSINSAFSVENARGPLVHQEPVRQGVGTELKLMIRCCFSTQLSPR